MRMTMLNFLLTKDYNGPYPALILQLSYILANKFQHKEKEIYVDIVYVIASMGNK